MNHKYILKRTRSRIRKNGVRKNHKAIRKEPLRPKITWITFISKDSQKKRTTKLEIDQTADVKGLIKNGIDFHAYYIPKAEADRVEKILKCLCCYKLDHHKAHKCPKRLGIKICSICTGKCWKIHIIFIKKYAVQINGRVMELLMEFTFLAMPVSMSVNFMSLML